MSSASPLFTVIVPVYNRVDELRRALASLQAQTLEDFECLVVDDGSTQPIKPTVDEFDDRFVYVSSPQNRGCTAARFLGFEHAHGQIVAQLDSDNEFFPWALERASHYLHQYPQVNAVAGLYLFPEGLRVRVNDGVRVVGPDEYAARSLQTDDSVGVVRRSIAEEWLQMRRYSNFDFVLWLRLRLSHSLVLVDEPWGRYDTAGSDRISLKRDPRELSDIETFVEEFRPLIASNACGPIDWMLSRMWLRLIRGGRRDTAALVADWMCERGVRRHNVLRQEIVRRTRRRLTPSAFDPHVL
ncbi:MAG TPA: glycosyltransferase family A protein [Solirubrobacteraceae bacterium]|jgi:glycosyltransferase involved in cell wall biosynthesis|nr:glycosyltransferase family A protein [Solirubrobacteraceae bacterium]